MKKYDSIRIFKNPILESFTHVHPIIPLLLWVPVCSYWLYSGITQYDLTLSQLLLWSAIALVVWTLTEYLLHRFVFHFPTTGPWSERFVYIFHGLHHDDPQDPTRLVMPPVPAILIVSLLYFLFGLVVPERYLMVFMAFFMLGYLCYDYIHYATHHFKMTSKIGRYLKKYHLQHHYSHEESKYGVSSPLWDYIFRTVQGPKKS